MSIRGFFRSVSDFLFSKANREFLIFLFFLVLAGIFWLIMTLNETYRREMKVVVHYSNVPKNAVITSGDTDTLRVTIEDKGLNIMSYLYGQVHRPIDIDFVHHAYTNGTGSVQANELQKLAVKELPASARIISVKPERLLFYYNNGESKRVPVKWHGHVTPQQLYYIAHTQVAPDSVTVYASRIKLDSIQAVYTEDISYSDVRDTLTVNVGLKTVPGAKMVPDRVTVRFITDVLTEVEINDIPVEGINMPTGKILRTFPAKVSVKFVTGMKNYQMLSPADFQVVADYREFSQVKTPKCKISMVRMPEDISNPRLTTTQVDYLIEEEKP